MKCEYLAEEVVAVSLEAEEVAIIKDATSDLVADVSNLPEATLLDEVEARAKASEDSLPQLREWLASFTLHSAVKVGLIDLSPFPTHKGPTPIAHPLPGEPNVFEQDLYRGFILGLAGLYGYGYSSQQHGTIHNNIVPIRQYATTTGHNASSESELGLHSEVASFNLGEGLDVSPDFLTLHYFRNNQHVPTTISIPDWSKVPAEVQRLLSEPWFYNRTSPAQGGSKHDPTIPVSVLYQDEADPWIRLNTSRLEIELYSGRQQEALMEFVTHLRARVQEIPSPPGQLALIDNRRVLHGRTAFKGEQRARYDGTDRWQRRITASTDAARIAVYETNQPRVVDMDLFRSTSSGGVR